MKPPLYHYEGRTAYVLASHAAAQMERVMVMAKRLSVPTDDIQSWYEIGWHYCGPDFDKPNHSLMEWRHNKPAVQPFKENQHGSINERA